MRGFCVIASKREREMASDPTRTLQAALHDACAVSDDGCGGSYLTPCQQCRKLFCYNHEARLGRDTTGTMFFCETCCEKCTTPGCNTVGTKLEINAAFALPRCAKCGIAYCANYCMETVACCGAAFCTGCAKGEIETCDAPVKHDYHYCGERAPWTACGARVCGKCVTVCESCEIPLCRKHATGTHCAVATKKRAREEDSGAAAGEERA